MIIIGVVKINAKKTNCIQDDYLISLCFEKSIFKKISRKISSFQKSRIKSFTSQKIRVLASVIYMHVFLTTEKIFLTHRSQILFSN